MAYVISFSIYKGGTGETTSAVNTAAVLAQLDQRVLLVDLDQQASSTRYVGVNPDEVNPTLYHVFLNQVPASVVRQKTKFGFDLLPSSGFMEGDTHVAPLTIADRERKSPPRTSS